jgi:hypothetical protein
MLAVTAIRLGHIKKIACLASPPDLKYSPDLKIKKKCSCMHSKKPFIFGVKMIKTTFF